MTDKLQQDIRRTMPRCLVSFSVISVPAVMLRVMVKLES
jgi:hypothetical protein